MQLSSKMLSPDEQAALIALNPNITPADREVIENLGKHYLMASNFSKLGQVIHRLFPDHTPEDIERRITNKVLLDRLMQIHREGIKILDELYGCTVIDIRQRYIIDTATGEFSTDQIKSRLTL